MDTSGKNMDRKLRKITRPLELILGVLWLQDAMLKRR